MGYGGGYYDRTIQKLRKEKEITIIGLGFLEQKSEKALPVDCNDQRLDVMVTNEKIFIF
jgi:5-formyltetrahydrofolate cyclo-ligase